MPTRVIDSSNPLEDYMDPRATLERLLDALFMRDADETTETACDLAEWFRKGGLAPSPEQVRELCTSYLVHFPTSGNEGDV